MHECVALDCVGLRVARRKSGGVVGLRTKVGGGGGEGFKPGEPSVATPIRLKLFSLSRQIGEHCHIKNLLTYRTMSAKQLPLNIHTRISSSHYTKEGFTQI